MRSRLRYVGLAGGHTSAAVIAAVAGFLAVPLEARAASYDPVTAGGPPVRVCLIDTGVPAGTPGVAERETTTGSLDPTDPHGAEMVTILRRAYTPVQVVSVQRDDARPTSVTTGAVIDLCASRSVRVIAMSFTLTGYNAAALQAAVDRARAAGVVLVAAAGNDGNIGAPANVPGVIGVGAVDTTGRTCPFSNASLALVMAPGCGVDGTATEGTSNAAAYVAGVAAARIGQDWSAAEVEAGLRAGDPALRTEAADAGSAPSAATPVATVGRAVRFRVQRLRGHRMRVRVIGRRRDESLFVRVAARDRRAPGSRITVRVGPRDTVVVSLVGRAGVVARRRVRVN